MNQMKNHPPSFAWLKSAAGAALLAEVELEITAPGGRVEQIGGARLAEAARPFPCAALTRSYKAAQAYTRKKKISTRVFDDQLLTMF
jgi:hypothetical protein